MSVRIQPHPDRRLRARTLAVLVGAQLVGGTGLTAAVTVGGLIAADLGGPGAAGLPLAAAVAGTGLAAVAIGSLAHRHGRRRGLRWGWQAGAAGAALAVVATVTGALPLLLLAMLLFGGGEAASTAARFAATDLPGRRGGAIGVLLTATAAATTVGPVFVGPTSAVAARLGLPPLTGPFVLAALAFAVAATVIGVALRPDPLLVVRRQHGPVAPEDGPRSRATLDELLRSPARRGVVALAVANLVMLGIMTVAPVQLAHTGHGTDPSALPDVGRLIGVHVAGMYAPSLLSGWLADRIGSRRVIALGGASLTLAGLLVARPAGAGTGPLTVALLLLGIGWNLAFVGGSLALTTAADERDRPRVQAAADAVMAAAGMVGSVAAGVGLATGGSAATGLVSAAVSAPLVLGVLRVRRQRSATGPAGAGSGQAVRSARRSRRRSHSARRDGSTTVAATADQTMA